MQPKTSNTHSLSTRGLFSECAETCKKTRKQYKSLYLNLVGKVGKIPSFRIILLQQLYALHSNVFAPLSSWRVLFSFRARPGFLGNLKSFEMEFVKRIERGQKHDATKRELAEARKSKL